MKRDIKVNRSFRKRGLGKYYTKIHRDWMSFRPPNPRLIFDISPDKSSQQQILCSDYYDNEATCLVHEAQYYVFCTNSWEQNLIVDSWKTKLVYPFPSRIYILHKYIYVCIIRKSAESWESFSVLFTRPSALESWFDRHSLSESSVHCWCISDRNIPCQLFHDVSSQFQYYNDIMRRIF